MGTAWAPAYARPVAGPSAVVSVAKTLPPNAWRRARAQTLATPQTAGQADAILRFSVALQAFHLQRESPHDPPPTLPAPDPPLHDPLPVRRHAVPVRADAGVAVVNNLAQHALAMARAGEWLLADSMEICARFADDPTVAGMLHNRGSEAFIGFVRKPGTHEYNECDYCAGSGEVDCNCGSHCCSGSADCEECDGSGFITSSSNSGFLNISQVYRWETLNGKAVGAEEASFSGSCWLSVGAADSVRNDWSRLVAWLCERGRDE